MALLVSKRALLWPRTTPSNGYALNRTKIIYKLRSCDRKKNYLHTVYVTWTLKSFFFRRIQVFGCLDPHRTWIRFWVGSKNCCKLFVLSHPVNIRKPDVRFQKWHALKVITVSRFLSAAPGQRPRNHLSCCSCSCCCYCCSTFR